MSQNPFVQLILLLLFGATGALIVLMVAGIIGPKWLKNRMRRLIRWYWGPASLIMPMDPYKPVGEALNEKASDFGSKQERVKNNNIVILGQLLLTFSVLALGFVLYILWRVHTE